MAITKEQILKKLEERRAQEAKKAKFAKKPVYSTKQEATQPVAKVVRESQVGGPRTIREDINQRTANFKGQQKSLYTTLAENIVNAHKFVSEATQASSSIPGAIGASAAGVGLMKTYFDIFFGYFPNLIVQELASVQPIKTKKAMIFYYQSVAGSTKGAVTAGDVFVSPFTVKGDAALEQYTSNRVTIAKNVAVPVWGPVVARSVQIAGQTLTWQSDTAATFGADGTVAVSLANSEITVTLGGTAAAAITHVTYTYYNEYAPTQVPELAANIDEREITAQTRTIKTNYSFEAGFGFEAQFGVSLQDRLAEDAMYQLKRATDLDFVFEIMASAPALVVWNKAAGVANGLYTFHKKSFVDAVVTASNHIFSISKRVRGNVLLVGIQAQTLVETLEEFKGETVGSELQGARVIGTLMNGIKVIAIPELPADEFAVIYRSKTENLDAGIVFAPYIPVVATPQVMLDDLLGRRAYLVSYGKLVTNANYFVKGRITNNPTALPVMLVTNDGTTTDMGVIGTDAVVDFPFSIS